MLLWCVHDFSKPSKLDILHYQCANLRLAGKFRCKLNNHIPDNFPSFHPLSVNKKPTRKWWLMKIISIFTRMLHKYVVSNLLTCSWHQKNESTNSPIHQFTNLKCCKHRLKTNRRESRTPLIRPHVFRLICVFCHNFWTNYDLDLFSTSKWW